MEEETSEEWKIVEKQGSGGGGKMSLLYRVGKKIVITGAVISSAPFVLPPLIVISSIGFFFAVPFGFVYASYACTNKIMSKLLSSPSNDVVRFKEFEEEGKDREEEEFEEDLKKNLEMRIELVGDEIGTEEKEGFEDQGIEEMGYEEEGETEELDESKKGNQLVPELLEEKRFNWNEEEPMGEIDAFYTIEEEGKREGEPIEGAMGTVIESIEKEEELYAGVLQTVEEIAYEKEDIPQEEFTFENIREEDGLMREKEGTGEKGTMEDYSLGKALQEEEVPFAGVMKAVEEYGSKENGVVNEKSEPNAIEEKEKPVIETNETVNDRRTGELDDNLIEKKPVMMEKEMNSWKNENAREIADESGLLLFEEVTVTSEQYIPETYKIREVTFEVDSLPQTLSWPPTSSMEVDSTDTMEDQNVGTVVHTVSAEMAETIPANLASEMKTTNSSKEVMYSEEKMWELIVAMRKIVGYKAAIQPSFTEELKALYIFTGVEPPVPFEDQLDLAEVNDKIRLLMAIIGVKT